MTQAKTLAGAALGHGIDWHSINWKKVYRTVRRLQARIVKATRAGRWHKVKSLVYLLTRSFSGKALAVLRVISNSGAKTPGVDGVLWNTPEAKSNALNTLTRRGYQPRPLRRVHIPKSNGNRRPLGIPTMHDRAMQALHLLGFDPIAETLADGHSYGFRRERCCADAIDECHKVLRGPHGRGSYGPDWVLEADIRSCFDRISHEWLMGHIFMDRKVLKGWLKAGYLEKHVLFATHEGTPQGGIISPVLANRALDGLQQLLTERFGATRRERQRCKVHLVRYADDFIITGTSRILLEYEVKPLVEHFLKERGLELSHQKTSITHIEDGFDFLGQTIRRYPHGKILIKPSSRSVKTFLLKIQETLDNSGSMNVGETIRRLNQQIKGWTMYHRHAVSKRIFATVKDRIFVKLKKWLLKRHRKKSWKWIKRRYFQREGDRSWVFTGLTRNGQGQNMPIRLMSVSRVKVIRWKKIRSEANPYDPAWEEYLEARASWKLGHTLAGRSRIGYLWKGQMGRCVVCGQPLEVQSEACHIHHRVWKCDGGQDTCDNLELLHANCHRQIHARRIADGSSRVP